jgi:DNA invertase Pin-like site-specific DNA recombinase
MQTNSLGGLMKIGYARVSTKEQNLDAQIDALKEAGCTRIFSEHVSGRKAKMPQFDACMEFLREGDTLVVRHIDRLNRGALALMSLHEELAQRGIYLKAIAQPIDTSDATLGKLTFQILSIIAESEHNLIKERSRLGMLAARARGNHPGRSHKLDAEKRALLIDAYKTRKYTVKQLGRMFDVSVSSLMRYTQEARDGVL